MSNVGKVVVNRSMSLDGFIAGPDNAMDWVIEYMREDPFPEVMWATGAMLIGRGTHEVAKRMSAQDTDYDGGPVFVLTHRPPDEPEQGVIYLTGDLTEALAYTRSQGGGTIAVASQSGASQAIIASGADVAGIGGFSGRESEPSVAWFADQVRQGNISWVLTGGQMGGDGRAGSSAVMAAVANACTAVPSSAYGGGDGTDGLYDCRGKADALAAEA